MKNWKKVYKIISAEFVIFVLAFIIFELIWFNRYSRKVIVPEDFSISLSWGIYGISSYDSRTGNLIKELNPTGLFGASKDDFKAKYYLSDDEKEKIYKLLLDIDFDSYPSDYRPYEEYWCLPMSLFRITVRYKGYEKAIYSEQFPGEILSRDYYQEIYTDKRSYNFIRLYDTLVEILTSTEEWKTMPQYDHTFD
jgi:hypothetical protein